MMMPLFFFSVAFFVPLHWRILGNNIFFCYLLCKKLSKNISLEETADMLEEETAAIAPIYDLLKSYPDWEDERICAGLVKPESQAPERGTDVSL